MIDRATLHAEQASRDKKNNGLLHRLACQRHLKDLERQGTEEFPYIWLPEKSQHIIDFAETLTIAEGVKPKPVHLYDCQCFDLGVTNGWVHKDTGFRRFRRSYKSKGRQNGKSFENGIQGTYYSNFGGYNYGKLYTVATKKRQARIAWEEIAKFVKIDPDLEELYKVQDYKSLITALMTHCTIEALSKEGGLDDGFRSVYNSIDEIHQHKDNSIYKALYNGTRSLPETLNSMVTTRGKNLNSFCKEMDDYCVNILNSSVTGDDMFVDIYCLDKKDDYFKAENWIKANPILCQTQNGLETMERDAQTAKDMGGSELADFVVKCLNLWYRDVNIAFVSDENFMACACDDTFEEFRGWECTVGLDVSSGGDLTTVSFEFDIADDEFFIESHSFMPKGRYEEHIKTDIAPYDVWVKDGLLTLTGGNADYVTDHKFIVEYLKKIREQYGLNYTAIGVDKNGIAGIQSELEQLGCPVIEVVQSCANLNDVTENYQNVVKSHKLHFNRKNELLSWSFLNAIIYENSYQMKKIDKEGGKRNRRIDPVDACIDARYASMKTRGKPVFDINASVESYLNNMGWV